MYGIKIGFPCAFSLGIVPRDNGRVCFCIGNSDKVGSIGACLNRPS